MPHTIDEALQWAFDNRQRYDYDTGRLGSWAGWCESFIYRAGGFTRSFGSAMLAGNASGYLNPDWASAPRGAIHYWAGVGGDGHVAFELGGGLLLMASNATWTIGTALGTIPFQSYAKLGLPYRGWSLRHGNETLATTGTSGGGSTPIEEDDMYTDEDRARDLRIENAINNTKAGVFDGASVLIDGKVQKFNYGILPIVVHNQTLIAEQSGKIAALESAVKQLAAAKGVAIDLAAIAAAAKAGAADATKNLVTQIDDALRDDFTSIPKAVNDDAAKRLSS